VKCPARTVLLQREAEGVLPENLQLLLPTTNFNLVYILRQNKIPGVPFDMEHLEGPIPEIGVPNRVNLLTKLKSPINHNVWACLWLSDIEVLERFVARVENNI
jgi:hypothetical protein